jgi:hypothetical protein
MLYKIIYNSKDVKEFVRYDDSLEIGFNVLEIYYSASERKLKIGDNSYFEKLLDNYIDFIENYPDANEIIIHNSVLSLLLRSIKYSINHIVDKDSFKTILKKRFLFYYNLTALLASNMLEENLIISGLYSVFLFQDAERRKRRKVLAEIKEMMDNDINNAIEKARENKIYEEFAEKLKVLKEKIDKKLKEIGNVELPVFKLLEHKIVYKDKELSYYVFPYLLEIKLDKPLIAYKENVVLEKEGIIRGYRDYEVMDLEVIRYRAKSV